MFVGLVLLAFFLVSYLVVAFAFDPDMVTALILFFGSIFVSIMLLLLTSRLLDTAKERSVEITEMLVGIIDARDPNLNGHSVYVKELTMLFYQYLPRHLRNEINPVSLEYAALMHDIGKLGVPDILNKPAKLDDEEWEVMRRHPKIGVNLLKPLKTFDSVSDWILCHHERIDVQPPERADSRGRKDPRHRRYLRGHYHAQILQAAAHPRGRGADYPRGRGHAA